MEDEEDDDGPAAVSSSSSTTELLLAWPFFPIDSELSRCRKSILPVVKSSLLKEKVGGYKIKLNITGNSKFICQLRLLTTPTCDAMFLVCLVKT